jgi:hypothetical protein
MNANRPADVVTVRVHGPLSAAQVRGLHERLEARLAGGDPPCSRTPKVVICCVDGCADVSVIDALARIALVATRNHAAVRVRSDAQELAGLLALTGLASVIRLELEPDRQAETREKCGVEEVMDVDDPPA